MNVSIRPVQSPDDIHIVAVLAHEIWTQHFTPIIGAPQVAYMLKKFQSEEVIRAQLSDGCRYFLAEAEERAVGYTGIIPDYPHKKMMISKLYVRDEMRGKGAGAALIKYVEQECTANGLTRLWLTVNRFNESAIGWYRRHGFSVINEVKKDIGCGFFMDDYIMEKNILSHPPPG